MTADKIFEREKLRADELIFEAEKQQPLDIWRIDLSDVKQEIVEAFKRRYGERIAEFVDTKLSEFFNKNTLLTDLTPNEVKKHSSILTFSFAKELIQNLERFEIHPRAITSIIIDFFSAIYFTISRAKFEGERRSFREQVFRQIQEIISRGEKEEKKEEKKFGIL